MMHSPAQGKIRKGHSSQPVPFGELKPGCAIHDAAVP